MERVYDLKLGKHKCGDCGGKFTVRHGTIFGDSKLPLRKWFKAIFLMTSHKKGISSCQLARDIGVMQKTAWFVLQRIREAARTEEFNKPLTGIIECDEMFVGGRGEWMHKARKKNLLHASKSKKCVLGMFQRGGELRLVRIPNTSHENIRHVLAHNIAFGSTVHN